MGSEEGRRTCSRRLEVALGMVRRNDVGCEVDVVGLGLPEGDLARRLDGRSRHDGQDAEAARARAVFGSLVGWSVLVRGRSLFVLLTMQHGGIPRSVTALPGMVGTAGIVDAAQRGGEDDSAGHRQGDQSLQRGPLHRVSTLRFGRERAAAWEGGNRRAPG